ncbi:DNA-3-methyladenine glycosylase [Dyadobacter sp. CY323]|uniref:DNA-3-methyladenine glycosylase family protein n=1 Tax=Dyadobacter sp. CY323 TaxID=2907302 RepID=UPI001F196F9A|nr:DNA-3-methyladenine glycosylase 2 family protein [Dyadobacter sp. CY323]MCE6991030.1 DNA-3-methyladenine glycosylase 2 family protein [Dyadobacter sp. CY323]
MIHTFEPADFQRICDDLAVSDPELDVVIQLHGYPLCWNRPNSFESLVHIILEQQVSLASALAALNKLKERIAEVTPENVLQLSDEELHACYFSRQKTIYVKNLAEAVLNGKLDLAAMELLPDEEIRHHLTSVKGIGNWTSDIYLMFALQRADVFPIGDLAAVNAMKRLKNVKRGTSQEAILKLAEHWKPYRTVATMLLWHYYLANPVKRFRTGGIKVV